MKSGLMLGLGLVVLPYTSAFIPGPAGNPDEQPYLGQAGGVYDSTANPPQTIGAVTYDPMAPLPKTTTPPATDPIAMPVPAK